MVLMHFCKCASVGNTVNTLLMVINLSFMHYFCGFTYQPLERLVSSFLMNLLFLSYTHNMCKALIKYALTLSMVANVSLISKAFDWMLAISWWPINQIIEHY